MRGYDGGMSTGRFQFSIGRLLRATTWIACAFGIAAAANRLDESYNADPRIGMIYFPAFWAAIGGGIGALMGNAIKWSLGGLVASIAFVAVVVLIAALST